MRKHVVPTVLIILLLTSQGLAQDSTMAAVHLNRVIQKVASGASVYGISVANQSVVTGRMLQASGLDFFVVDMEHQTYDWSKAKEVLLGLRETAYPTGYAPLFTMFGGGAPDNEKPIPFVKVGRLGREGVEFDVRHALKIGFMGAFIPYAESAAQIEEAVRAAVDPESGYAIGTSPEDHEARNGPWPLYPRGEFLIGAMVESETGEANLDAMLDVPGLGIVWLAHPSSPEAELEMLQKCLRRGIPVAVSDYNPEHFARRHEEGFRMHFLGWDTGLLQRGIQDVLGKAQAHGD